MKKNLIIIALLFSTILNSKAQSWAQPGATWYYSYNTLWFTGYYKVEKIGDTIINNITCDNFLTTEFGFSYLNSLAAASLWLVCSQLFFSCVVTSPGNSSSNVSVPPTFFFAWLVFKHSLTNHQQNKTHISTLLCQSEGTLAK